MSLRECVIVICVFFLPISMDTAIAGDLAAGVQDPAQARPDQTKPPEIERITVEELKAKLAKDEAVTIVDLRAGGDFVNSTDKIKGAIHMKARRLRYRLSFAPFK